MANRGDLNFSPSVTNVVPEIPQGNALVNMAANIGEIAAEQSANAKALAATAQTQTAFRQLDEKFRMENADNPDNPEALKSLQDARKEIVDQIGGGVPSMVMREYTNKTVELGQQSDASNTLWATKQHMRNAMSGLQTGTNSYYQQANQAGRDYASNHEVDLSTALNYFDANATLHKFADPVLGSEKTGAYLKNFNTNYVKSFVAGVAEGDPQRAAALLEDPNIKQHFTTQDIGDMAQLIQRTQKQQQLIQTLQTVKTTGDITGLVNDPNSTYFEKRAEIDRLDMQGSITPKAAAAARRVIKSAEDLDSQTDTPVMADIVKQVYDLNENTSLKQSEYLNGIKSLQDLVLEKQGANQLSSHDAVKLTKEIQTLTQKRVSDATKSVGYQFGDANKKFDQLPPEYRGEATRQLFYNSFGQNLSKQQLSSQADGIIDQINKKRRNEALSIISRTTSDDVFLQAAGYSRADVAETAKARGITQDQVIQAMRDKFTAKPRRAKPVKGVAPEDTTTDMGAPAGIQLDGPAPDSMNDGTEE